MASDLEFNIILSQTDGRPMYVQIMEQVKSLVTIGDWPQGYNLPSIREMAVATRVSVITVKRAYQELESEGVIVTQHGKGSFISQVDNLSAKLKKEEMETHLNQAMQLAKSIGMNKKQLLKKLDEMQKENGQPNKLEKNND